MRRQVGLLAGLLLIVSLAGCGKTATRADGAAASSSGVPTAVTGAGEAKRKIVLGTATKGGVYWPLGQEMAAIWNVQVPGVEVLAIITGGSTENIQRINTLRDMDFGLSVSGVAYYAATGSGEFKAQGKQVDLRGVMGLYPNVLHLVIRPDSGIKSLRDLKNKSWAPGKTGSATEVQTREVLDLFEVDSWGKMKNYFVGFEEAAGLMGDKKVDGATFSAGAGAASVQDAIKAGAELLSLSELEVKKITEALPSYFPITLPPGTYKGQSKAVQAVAQGNILLARADLPDELIYTMVKAIYVNQPQLAAKITAAQDIRREDGLRGLKGVVPLHPGAEKYFREIGILK